jgi:hypothetical protein
MGTATRTNASSRQSHVRPHSGQADDRRNRDHRRDKPCVRSTAWPAAHGAPGPDTGEIQPPWAEAHELCVYFGRITGGKRGGFLAGLGFMLPGFLLMPALSVLYVEAHLDELLR